MFINNRENIFEDWTKIKSLWLVEIVPLWSLEIVVECAVILLKYRGIENDSHGGISISTCQILKSRLIVASG